MKKIVLIMSMLISSSLFARESLEMFSPIERQAIVSSIDSACGDSWCEGDYDFRFKDFSCNKLSHSCYLFFNFIKIDEQERRFYSKEQVCEFKNISKLDQILDGDFLNEKFYDEISNCINERQSLIEF